MNIFEENELFRNFIKKFQATPTSHLEAKYEKQEKPTLKAKNPLQPKLKSNDFKIK